MPEFSGSSYNSLDRVGKSADASYRARTASRPAYRPFGDNPGAGGIGSYPGGMATLTAEALNKAGITPGGYSGRSGGSGGYGSSGYRGGGGGGGGGYGNALAAQLRIIDEAIADAKYEAGITKDDYGLRQKAAFGDLKNIYGGLQKTVDQTGVDVNRLYAKQQETIDESGQELVDAIIRNNEEAVGAAQEKLKAAGITGVDSEGMKQNLAIGQNIAQGQSDDASEIARMQAAAQQRLGKIDSAGVGRDHRELKEDVGWEVKQMIAEVDDNLADYIREQTKRKADLKKGYSRSSGSYGGGGSSYRSYSRSRGGSGSSGGSSGSGMSLPSDAKKVNLFNTANSMLADIQRQSRIASKPKKRKSAGKVPQKKAGFFESILGHLNPF